MNSDKVNTSLSPDVSDLLQKMPGKFITYASLFFLVFTITLVFVAWLVKYPDLIEGKITIQNITPPLRLITKSSGELINIKVAENQKVKEGQVIAEVKSLMSPEAISVLKQITTQDDSLNLDFLLASSITFGEMQSTLNELREHYANYKELQKDLRLRNEITLLNKQLENQDKLATAAQAEIALKEKVMETHQEKFNMYKDLFATNGVSKLEFLNRQEEYYEHQIRLSTMKKGLTQQQVVRDEIAQKIKNLRLQRREELRIVKQSIYSSLSNIVNFLSTFQSNNLLVAPTDGVLSYLSNLHEGLFVTIGSSLFAIVPEEERYYGTVLVSQKGFGKVKVGQKVIIELDQYASSEYGVISGFVEEISLLQLDNQYRVTVVLPDDIVTNFGENLILPPESLGTAKIVAEDIRLIERLFYNFRKLTSGK